MSILRIIKARITSNTAVPHLTTLSVMIGIGVSAVTLLVMATLDVGLFGQEAEAPKKRTS